jgi:hypothetical protein
MVAHLLKSVCGTVALVAALAAPARAQVLTNFADLPMRLNVGDSIVVRTSDASWRGRLVTMTRDALTVRVNDNAVTLDRDHVREVSAVTNAMARCTLIGFTVGAALGGLAGAEFNDHADANDVVTGALMIGGIFAGVGAGVGSMLHRTTVVYRAPALRPAVTMDPARRSVQLTWRW